MSHISIIIDHDPPHDDGDESASLLARDHGHAHSRVEYSPPDSMTNEQIGRQVVELLNGLDKLG